MKRKFGSRALAWIMALCMVVSLIPGMAVTAEAVGYSDAKITAKSVDGNGNITSLTVTFTATSETSYPIAMVVGDSAAAPTLTTASASDFSQAMSADSYYGVAWTGSCGDSTSGSTITATITNGNETILSSYYLHLYCYYNNNWGPETNANNGTQWPKQISAITDETAITTQAALEAAIAAANAGDTVKLEGNITLTSALNIATGKNIVLDLNGYTLTGPSSSYWAVNVENTAKLTVTDSGTGGKITGCAYGVQTAGEAAVTGGTVEGTTAGIFGNAATANVTVSGGTVKGTGTSNSYGITTFGTTKVEGGTVSGATGVYNNGGSLTVSAGAVTGTTYGVQNINNGTVTVSGGTVSGNVGVANSGTLNVSGGSIVGTGGDGITNGYNGSAITTASGTVNMTGGYVKGGDYAICDYASGVTGNVLSGGKLEAGKNILTSDKGDSNSNYGGSWTVAQGGEVQVKLTNSQYGPTEISAYINYVTDTYFPQGQITVTNKDSLQISPTGDSEGFYTLTGGEASTTPTETASIILSAPTKLSGSVTDYQFADVTVTANLSVFSISVSNGSFKLTDATGFSYGVKSTTSGDATATANTEYTSVQYSGSDPVNALKSIVFTKTTGTAQTVTVSGVSVTLGSNAIYFEGHVYEVSTSQMTWKAAMEWSLGKNNTTYTAQGFTPTPIEVSSLAENNILVNFYNTKGAVWLSAIPANATSSFSIDGTTLTITGKPSVSGSVNGSGYCWLKNTGVTLPNNSGHAMSSVWNGTSEPNNGGPVYLGYRGAYWDDLTAADPTTQTSNWEYATNYAVTEWVPDESASTSVVSATATASVTDSDLLDAPASTVTTASVGSLADLKSALADSDITEITLTGDFEITETLNITHPVTIKGAGKTLTRGGASTTGNSSDDFTGTLFSVTTGGDLKLENVTIDGGAKWLNDDGSAWTDGGNAATRKNDTEHGGIVAAGQLITVGVGSVTLGDGTILQNNDRLNNTAAAADQGSAVYVYGSGSLSMSSSAVIKDNTVAGTDSNGYTGDGAAVSVEGGASVQISGTITGNYAPRMGGAIRLFQSIGTAVTIKDASITKNYTSTDAYYGAVCLGVSPTVSGKVIIEDNYLSDGTTQANVGSNTSSAVINGGLTAGSRIGIFSSTSSYENNNYKAESTVLTGAAEGDKAYFTSDNTALTVVYDNGVLKLKSVAEIAADGFIKTYLTKDNAIITAASEDNYEQIMAAEGAWKALSDAAKAAVNAKLTAAKGSELTYPDLLTAAEAQDAAVKLAAAQTTAAAAIDTAATAAKNAIDAMENLSDEEKTAWKAAVDAAAATAKSTISEATTPEAVESAKAAGTAAIDLIGDKAAATAAINKAASDEKAAIDAMSDLTAEEKAELKAAVDTAASAAKDAINNATTPAAVKAAKLDGIEAIRKITAYAAIDALSGLTDAETVALKSVIDAILAGTKTDAAGAADDDAEALAQAKGDAKTELVLEKAAAFSDINGLSNLTDTQKATLKDGVTGETDDAIAAIDDAATVDAVTSAKETGAADIFVAAYLTGTDGQVYVCGTDNNYRQIKAGSDNWKALTAAEQALVNAALTGANNGKDLTYDTLLLQANQYPILYYPSTGATVVNTSNGTVAVDLPGAVAGQSVVITVLPDAGYALGALTVTDSKGNPVALTALGNGKYSFTMPANRPVTIQSTFVLENCDGGESCPSAGFTDLDLAQWYHEGIDYVMTRGMMNGTGNGTTFSPYMTTSRAMIWTILARLDGVDTNGGSVWYEKGRDWAMANGVSDGTNPDNAITREQLAAMLYRYAVSKGYDVSVGESTNILSYSDAFDASQWAIPALQWAVGEGIITNKNGDLAPGGDASRAEAATMLMRFCTGMEA